MNSIQATLEYDFDQEKSFSYAGISARDAVKHITKFTSGIWQIHPFAEGNTRTTAVFILKYLRSFGFNVNNDLFAQNSWYFRNALVRANYNNLCNGITATSVYLLRFFENLLLNEHHELKNRYIHVDFKDEPKDSEVAAQSANADSPKCKNCTLDELSILTEIQKDPGITQKSLAERIGKSERTIKNRTVEMQQKGMIKRENGKRNGRWIIQTGFDLKD